MRELLRTSAQVKSHRGFLRMEAFSVLRDGLCWPSEPIFAWFLKWYDASATNTKRGLLSQITIGWTPREGHLAYFGIFQVNLWNQCRVSLGRAYFPEAKTRQRLCIDCAWILPMISEIPLLHPLYISLPEPTQ